MDKMNETRELTHLDLFSGIGGFALAAGWAGFTTVGFCEIEPFCREVLMARFGAIADPERPTLFSNIRTLDGSRFRNVSLLTGGFPCQPFSVAGKRKGKDDNRHLWPEMLRVIHEAKPRWVIGENVAGFINMALDEVCADLEGEGYEVQPIVIPACAVNAPHRRDRVWIIGNSCELGLSGLDGRRPGEKFEDGYLSPKHSPNNPESHELSAPDAKIRGIRRGKASGQSGLSSLGGEIVADSERDGKRTGLCPGRQGRERGRRSTDLWGTPWIEVATSLCGIPHGLSDWLHRNRRGLSAKTAEKITRQDLPHLWAHLQSQEIYERLGGCEKVPVKENVFAVLWQFFTKSINPSLSTESAEAQEAMLRNVWHDHKPGCSPCRWEYQEQYARERADALSFLSYEIAHETKQLVQKYSKQRVNRLKSLGNSIVPQVAYEILKTIAEIERGKV